MHLKNGVKKVPEQNGESENVDFTGFLQAETMLLRVPEHTL